MSILISLDIGCFSWERGASEFIIRPLTAATLEAAILQAGGLLLADGHGSEPQLTDIARLLVRHGGQNVLGFLGRVPVVLHPSGYVRLALDQRSAGPVAAFLRLLISECGCEVYVWANEEQDPARVIAWLEQMAEQKLAEPLYLEGLPCLRQPAGNDLPGLGLDHHAPLRQRC